MQGRLVRFWFLERRLRVRVDLANKQKANFPVMDREAMILALSMTTSCAVRHAVR